MVQRAQAFGLAAGDYERGRPGYPEAALDWLLDGSSIRRVLDGSAESIPLPDDAVDAVLAGTAWHWFDRDCAPAEIARVLRPGGVLGIVWNLRDDGEPWVATLTQILYGGSDSTSTLADEPPPDPGPLFAASQMRRFAHAALMDGHGLLALVRSRSYFVIASQEQQRAILAAVEELLATHPDLAARESFALPYVTHALRARLKRPAAPPPPAPEAGC